MPWWEGPMSVLLVASQVNIPCRLLCDEVCQGWPSRSAQRRCLHLSGAQHRTALWQVEGGNQEDAYAEGIILRDWHRPPTPSSQTPCLLLQINVTLKREIFLVSYHWYFARFRRFRASRLVWGPARGFRSISLLCFGEFGHFWLSPDVFGQSDLDLDCVDRYFLSCWSFGQHSMVHIFGTGLSKPLRICIINTVSDCDSHWWWTSHENCSASSMRFICLKQRNICSCVRFDCTYSLRY